MLLRKKRLNIAFMLALVSVPMMHSAALAVDPPYQAQLERLSSVMGSLYYLAPLCGHTEIDWRGEMAKIIERELPDEDRRARLVGQFNAGFTEFARQHSFCGYATKQTIERFLIDAADISQDIFARYSE